MPDEPRIPKPVRQPRDVEPGKLADALDGLPKRAGKILRFIAATGCRPGEACKLEWEHAHLDAGLCILPVHKTAALLGHANLDTIQVYCQIRDRRALAAATQIKRHVRASAG